MEEEKKRKKSVKRLEGGKNTRRRGRERKEGIKERRKEERLDGWMEASKERGRKDGS